MLSLEYIYILLTVFIMLIIILSWKLDRLVITFRSSNIYFYKYLPILSLVTQIFINKLF